MSLMKVIFPAFTGWWAEAQSEMIKFPHGSHDDFVDTLSLFGLGLYLQRRRTPDPKPDKTPKFGTLGWVIENAAKERKRERESVKIGGW
jgi:hypothetical protein